MKPPTLGAENTTALLATLRLDIVDEAVMFQTVPLLKETLVVEVASVCIAPVSVEALALKAIALPFVALRRSPAPALATVLPKLTVAVDAMAKIKSPVALPKLKLSKVATALVGVGENDRVRGGGHGSPTGGDDRRRRPAQRKSRGR